MKNEKTPRHIKIIINGFPELVRENASISELIILYREGDADLIVEHNGVFVRPARYESARVLPEDRLEFINPNFGG